MRAIVGLLALGWVLETPWVLALLLGVGLFGLAFMAWALMQRVLELKPAAATWTRVEPRFESWTAQEQSSNRAVLMARIEELERDLRDARGEVKSLQVRNERLERDLQDARAAEANSHPNPLYRRVGLDERAPDWVITAVRKAYRKHLHPDAHPQGRKAEAERRFKEAEEVFAGIARIRNFGS